MTPKITVIFCDTHHGDEPPCDPSIYGSITVSAEDFEDAARIVHSALHDMQTKTYDHEDLAAFEGMSKIMARRGVLGCDTHLNPHDTAHAIDSDEVWIVWFDGDDLLVDEIEKDEIKLNGIMCKYDSDVQLALACEIGKVEVAEEEIIVDASNDSSEPANYIACP